ncbi:MAG: 50S ribosomal protein L6 [Candidatus Omnitrophota bacterium]
MSRLGKKPIGMPKDAKLDIKDGIATTEGPKGKLHYTLPRGVSCEQKDGKLFVKNSIDTKQGRSLYGTARALLANMLIGVTQGYAKTLIIQGVGYKAQVQGKILKLNVGFTHPVEYEIPEGIKIDAAKQVEVTISGIDKVQVGQVSAEIRHVCPPEPYKGKGIRYADERVRRKVGKAVTK